MSEGLCSQAEFHQHGATIPDQGPVQKYFLNSSKIHSQNSGELGSNCLRHWQPAVFSGKISPTNPAVQVAQNLAYPSSDAYLVMENSPGLSQGQPLQTHTWRSWSHGTSSLLWGIICWWPQEGKKEHWSLGELLTKSWIWEILGKYSHREIQFPLCNVRQGNSHSPYPRKVSSLLTQLPEKFYHKTEAQIFFPL